MSLKALANAALLQCAERTLPAHSIKEAPAHSSQQNDEPRTLQSDPNERNH
jgi:hypothetical protein